MSRQRQKVLKVNHLKFCEVFEFKKNEWRHEVLLAIVRSADDE